VGGWGRVVGRRGPPGGPRHGPRGGPPGCLTAAEPRIRPVPGPISTALGKTAERVPGLRRIPIVKLLVLGEVAVLARAHLSKLDAKERRRLLELIRISRGRTSSLSAHQRRELRSLVAKAEPRVFAGTAVEKLSPVSLPDRLLYGSSSKSRQKKKKG